MEAQPAIYVTERGDTSWMAGAPCKGTNAELFHPGRGDAFTVEAAKAVCNGCVVRELCGEYAITYNEQAGIWGGMSERERRKIRKQRQANTRTKLQ